MTYIQRFEHIVKEIAQHPYLEVVTFDTFPPLSGAAVDEMMGRKGMIPDATMKAFYTATNGLRLDWRFVQRVSDQEVAALSDKYDDYEIEWPDSDFVPFARIHLLPLEDVLGDEPAVSLRFLSELDVHKKYIIGNTAYAVDELRQRMKPFDIFSGDYVAAFFLPDGEAVPYVLLVSQIDQEWEDTLLTDFATYLEMILITRGIVEARERILREEGGLHKPVLSEGEDYFKARIKLRDNRIVAFTPKLFSEPWP